MSTIPDVALNDGTTLPELGLGTYNLRGEKGVAAIVAALASGYRLLDSAVNYRNEDEVGEAVRASDVPRDQIVVTTKVPGREHGYEEAIASTEASLGRLGLDHVDLSLIHWPNPSRDLWVETFRGMLEAQRRGLIRSVGVSNFTIPMLTRLIDETGVTPSVNQVELHPYFPQAELRAFHAERGIRTESWSPLARRSDLLAEHAVREVADAHGVTPTQAVLRWHVQLGSTPIPKSQDPQRQRENADVFGFSLTEDEVARLSGLERGRLADSDPNHHEEM